MLWSNALNNSGAVRYNSQFATVVLLIWLPAFKRAEWNLATAQAPEHVTIHWKWERKLSTNWKTQHSCALRWRVFAVAFGERKWNPFACICERNYEWLEKSCTQCGYLNRMRWSGFAQYACNTGIRLAVCANYIWINLNTSGSSHHHHISSTWQRTSCFTVNLEKHFFSTQKNCIFVYNFRIKINSCNFASFLSITIAINHLFNSVSLSLYNDKLCRIIHAELIWNMNIISYEWVKLNGYITYISLSQLLRSFACVFVAKVTVYLRLID